MANGAKLTQGWSDAYEVDFTQGGGEGDRPIVLSYDSSPAFTVPTAGEHLTTSALLDTCFRQVEYAGVLAGAAEPRRRRGAGRLHASPPSSRRRCRRACTSSRSTRREAAAGLGEVRRAARPTRTPSTRPTSPRTATSGCGSGATSPPDDRPRWTRRCRVPLDPRRPGRCGAGAGARRLLRAAGQRDARAGLLVRRHASTPAGCSRCWAGRASHRVLWFTVWSASAGDRGRACCSACRRRTCCTGCASRAGTWSGRCCWCRSCCRPSWSASRSGSCSGRPGRWASSASTGPPVAIIAGLVFFNVAVVIRAVGAAWESLDPRPGEAAAALGASPAQVFRTVTLPGAAARRSCRRRAWCSCSAPRRSAWC